MSRSVIRIISPISSIKVKGMSTIMVVIAIIAIATATIITTT